jgi:hypothetical protein
VEEFRADPSVEADAAGDVLDIRPHPLAEISDSLMKLILVARNAFAAYLITSAVSRSVKRIGVSLSESGR